ncbi:hypothetical protein TWF694_006481 [Orbilia ellipsospora]|uniref:Ankyrin repeat protein n=1 Tax=Orbilia ellipsospora TaxID=2528407 RepID=A0AAV9XLM0_9PEZI
MASETQSKLDAKSNGSEHGVFNSRRPVYHETTAVFNYRPNNGEFNANEILTSMIQQTENISLLSQKGVSESSLSIKPKVLLGNTQGLPNIQTIPKSNLQNIPKPKLHASKRPENAAKPQRTTLDPDVDSDAESEDEMMAEKLQWNDRKIRDFCKEENWGKAQQYLETGLKILQKERWSELFNEYHLQWTMTLIVVQACQRKWEDSLLTVEGVVAVGSKITGFFEHWRAYFYHKLGNVKSARRHCKKAVRLRREGVTEEPGEASNQHLSVKLMVDILRDMESGEWELEFYESMLAEQLTLAEPINSQVGVGKIDHVFMLERVVGGKARQPKIGFSQEKIEPATPNIQIRTSRPVRPAEIETSLTQHKWSSSIPILAPQVDLKHPKGRGMDGKIICGLFADRLESTTKLVIENNDLKTAEILFENPDHLKKAYRFDHTISQILYTSTPLYHAIVRDNPEMIRLILRKGHSPNDIPLSVASAPLHFALKLPSSSESTIMALINGGADVNQKTIGYNHLTPIMTAISRYPNVLDATYGLNLAKAEEYIRILLREGADPTIPDDVGDTALHYAVRYGVSLACVRLLLEHGPSAVNHYNNDGKLPAETPGSSVRVRGLFAEMLPQPGGETNRNLGSTA